MKIAGRTVMVVVLLLSVGTMFRAVGQVLLSSSKHGTRVEGENRSVYHVYLEPQQELETVEVIQGCITFITEVRFTMVLPFGNAVGMMLPPGSSWPIPAGKYKLNNPTASPIEYVLKTDGPCSNISPK